MVDDATDDEALTGVLATEILHNCTWLKKLINAIDIADIPLDGLSHFVVNCSSIEGLSYFADQEIHPLRNLMIVF